MSGRFSPGCAACPAEDFTPPARVSEGLENRLANAARKAGSLAELLELAKTRRYPLTGCKGWFGRPFSASPPPSQAAPAQGGWNPPPYIRVLGMNERGGEILRQAKPRLPLLTKASQLEPLDERSRKGFCPRKPGGGSVCPRLAKALPLRRRIHNRPYSGRKTLIKKHKVGNT